MTTWSAPIEPRGPRKRYQLREVLYADNGAYQLGRVVFSSGSWFLCYLWLLLPWNFFGPLVKLVEVHE